MENVMCITTDDMPGILEISWLSNQPVGFLSHPGVGKSQVIYQFLDKKAKSLGLIPHVVTSYDEWLKPGMFGIKTYNAVHIESVDVKGAMFTERCETTGEMITKCARPEDFPPASTEIQGCLFFDETTNAGTQQLFAIAPVVNDRIAGSHKIAPNVRVIIAGNMPEDGANIPPDMFKSRVQWFEVVPLEDVEYFEAMYRINRPINPYIEGFTKTMGADAMHETTMHPEKMCSVNRRTIEKASDALKFVDIKNLKMVSLQVGGWLGYRVAHDFISFLKLSEAVDIDAMMDNPNMIIEFRNQHPTLYAISAALIERGLNPKLSEKVFGIILALDMDEYGAFIIKQMINRSTTTKITQMLVNDDKNSHPNGAAVSRKYSKYFIER